MSTFRKKVQATTNWARPATAELAHAPRAALRAAGSQSRPKAPPVTAHRLFPAFATLWFAALFGLGSLAISSEALGALVTMIGLPALVPAAAPPLGFTAHLLVAFGFGTLGAALGLVLALRLQPQALDACINAGINPARPRQSATPFAEPDADEAYKVRARDAHPDAPPRRPLVLTEAFDPSLADAPAVPMNSPAAPLLRRKPGKLASDDTAEADRPSEPWIAEFAPGGAGAVQPLDLATLDLAALDLADLEDPAIVDAFAPDSQMADEATQVVGAVAMPQAEAAPEAPAEGQTACMPAVPVLIAATPQLPVRMAAELPAGLPADRPVGGWSPVAGVPPDSLGLVQLIERLALAIAARKTAGEVDPAPPAAEMPTAAEVPSAATTFTPGPFSAPLTPENRPQTAISADGLKPVSARETILHRLEALAPAEAQTAAGSAPPFSRPAAAAAAPAAQAEPVACPAVPFETDEALRAALATLQRMSARG